MIRPGSMLFILVLGCNLQAQISHPGITSTSGAAGDHAFVGTHNDGIFTDWLGTGSNATAYNLLGFTSPYSGFGIVNAPNIVSPIIWMYEYQGRNALRVRTMKYQQDMTSGKDLFTVRANGRIGIGTVSPEENLHVNGTTTIVGDIGVPSSSHWQTGNHTLELQNSDAGEVVLSFHRGGYTNAAIKHTPLGGLIFSGSGVYDANHLFLKSNGYLGIGTTAPDSKLTVKGNIHAEEVKVDLSVPGPDYVFKKDYPLKTLEEVQSYIKEHGHLPNIPSAQEMKANGIDIGSMNMKLLEKVEELTLYIISQEKRILEQEQKIKSIQDINIRIDFLSESLDEILKNMTND